ncbi:MAG: ABC transporter permease [Desulfobacteraceae bacterium]|jgi:putative ABC transport system permease protein
MFTNFLKVTLRNLYREKMYAIINIFGLSLAIACCFILGLYLRSELTYDQHNRKYKQIFRVVNEFNKNGKIDSYATTSKLLGPMLIEEYPEIKGFVRFRAIGEDIALPGDKLIDCTVYMADDNVFDVFTHDIIYGDPKTALLDPTGVVVSESFAKKYFGDENPIGKVIDVDTSPSIPRKITLVFADLPENSHLKYDMLISYNSDEMDYADPGERSRRLWGVLDFTYLLMPEDYNVRDFKEISDSFYAHRMEAIGKNINITWRSWLQPLADIHLQSDVGLDLPTGNKLYLYGFAAVAFFILLVACINYMNLATAARAAKRAKEVGMRKILGSGRVHLMFQFLGESIFFSLTAMILGIVLSEAALKLTPINELLSKPLVLNLSHEPGLLGWMFVFSLAIGLLSGLYPALYLSSMTPLSAIMYTHRAGKGSIRLRELLVLIQFIISVSVIASTLLMALQMRYISHKSLGFDKKNKVIITLKGADLIDKMPTIKKELLKNSSIQGVSLISNRLGHRMRILTARIDNNNGVPEMTSLKYMQVKEDFIEVMGMELAAGRDFSQKLSTDKEKAFIVNETMVKKMGWDDPLGKRIQMAGGCNGRVIGVVKDFHFASLHSQVEPFALNIVTGNMNIPAPWRLSIRMYMLLNIKGDDIPSTLKFLKDKLSEFDPGHPFKLEFLDDSLNKLYLSEQSLMKLIGIFAVIGVLISCMGLFGLSAFATEQRTKELGIRKVLGATTWQNITMLFRRILLLVSGGAIIGSFAAYYAMDEWLTDFAYRIGINPLVFLLSAFLAACVAFLTVALQSYKTARANPVNALRYQ